MKDLETKGYVVIPNFLDSTIIEELISDYTLQKKVFLLNYDKNKKHNIISCRHKLDHLLKNIISRIIAETNLNLGDSSTGGAYFDNQISQFEWHQDHEPYFKYRDSYNAVNFWIPFIKEHPDKSGLSVIPHDEFYKQSPDVFKSRIEGKGAKVFLVKNSSTIMRDDSSQTSDILPFDINDLSVTPDLGAGDLLILRQDLIHRTQDTINERVAISVRCYAKDAQVVNTNDFSHWLIK
jgi:Phytanoyl-CoA dioxygenase (PhyH)